MKANRSDRGSNIRSDIQALRGLAIALVVLYHADLGFPGGFLGVDVFFVISGFVITSTLIREMEFDANISLSRFYLRRLRRLLPALVLMLIVILPLTAVAMSPYFETQQVSKTAAAALLFSANAHLFAMSSYENLIDSPLRHLWSLGVEEHFYVVFPGLVLIATKYQRDDRIAIRRRIFALASSVLVVSLALSLAFSYQVGLSSLGWHRWVPSVMKPLGFHGDWVQRFSFFASPLRFWEIIAGVLVACRTASSNRSHVAMTGFVVLALIAGRAHYPSSFPGILAVSVVIVTALTIAWSNPEATFVSRLGSSFVRLGDVSYALYLWHWPLLVLARKLAGDQLIVRITVVGVSVLVAALSTRFVESGFTQSRWPLWPIALGVVVAAVSVLATSQVGSLDVVRARVPQPESKFASFASRNSCHSAPEGWEQSCVFVFWADDASELEVYLFGDSNARHASDGVAAALRDVGGQLTIGVEGGCPFVREDPPASTFSDGCRNLNRQRWELLKVSPPDVLVVVNHVTSYLTPDYPRYNSLTEQLELNREMLLQLSARKIPVLFQMQVPFCKSAASTILRPRGKCETTTTEERSRIKFSRDLMSSGVFRRSSVVALDLTEAICGMGPSCYANRGGMSLYMDPIHLSATFSRELGPIYRQALLEAASATLLNQ